jgi:hypothetical protein
LKLEFKAILQDKKKAELFADILMEVLGEDRPLNEKQESGGVWIEQVCELEV